MLYGMVQALMDNNFETLSSSIAMVAREKSMMAPLENALHK